MTTVAEVRLWKRTIGTVSLEEGDETAAFVYDLAFAQSGIKNAPLTLPLSKNCSLCPVRFVFGSSDNNRPFKPDDALSIHESERRWLEAQLQTPYTGRTVVVSHHAPHPLCRHPAFHDKGTLINSEFPRHRDVSP